MEGTNDLSNWAVLDRRVNEMFLDRNRTNVYTFVNTTAYAAYRFNVTANNGDIRFQFAELQLFEVIADGGVSDAGSTQDASETGNTADAGASVDAAE